MKRIVHCLLVASSVGVALPIAAQPRRFAPPEQPQALRLGDEAPNFKLRTQDGQREVELSSFKGKKPVVLVFGSFT